MRLRNKTNGVQITVHEEKGDRLVAQGTYQAVPDDEQTPLIYPVRYDDLDGPTSIGAAINGYDQAPRITRVQRATR